MITSLIILVLCSVTAPQAAETDSPNNQTSQPTTGMTDSGDDSESQTTTSPLDVTNTETTTSQSAWLTQKSTVLTTFESMTPTLDSTETAFPAEVNDTTYSAAVGDRNEQDLAGNPGLVAVLCIFSIVVAIVVVVVIVKAVRSRRPQFERLDDVPMGKINEDAPFARYPPK